MTKTQELAFVLHSIALRIPHAHDPGHEVSLEREWDKIYAQWEKAVQKEEEEQLFIVFNGPPSADPPRFVEVENAHGEGVGGIDWSPWGDHGLWALGPFKRR